MSGRTQAAPDLLSPYVSSFRKFSLLLITYVLGATSNWLLLRLLRDALQHQQREAEGENEPEYGVILVSFLRDYAFWKEGARKLGVDVGRSAAQNRFVFVDGLTELFAGGRAGVQGDHVVLRDAKLQSIEAAVLDLIGRMNGGDGGSGSTARRTLVLLDGLDFVMAAAGESAYNVSDMVMEWRLKAHALAVTMSADSPLIHDVSTPLETSHLELVHVLGHQSSWIMSTRLLDSGAAKDVSGVLRVSRGAEAEPGVDGTEVLYFVGGDGKVKIFERGSGS